MSKSYNDKAKKTINPYGDGNTSDKIIDILKDFVLNKKIDVMKIFYDLEAE
jgi:GDP/UDP-N,N'-diacetylbacillosamine 2-epimerase (hydrolysing)